VKDFAEHHGAEVCKGLVGVGSTVLGVLTSMQEQVEHVMRCVSLGIGMLVGILTAISIVRGWKRKP